MAAMAAALLLLLLLLPSVYCSGAHQHQHQHQHHGSHLQKEEFEMSSEVSRRVLASSSKNISYAALRSDSTPCSRRGASYYNCRPGAQANPYYRGCSTTTRCRI